MNRFEMHVDRQGDAVVLSLSGEFDLTCKHEFETHWRELLGHRFRSLVLDLRAVSFIDSTGLGFILELWSRSRRDGWDFAVVRAPDHFHQTFETAGLDRALPIIDALPEGTRA
jgi:anti-anti-sigma factor